MEQEKIAHINFRVYREDIISFKKNQLILQEKQGRSISNREAFVFLLKSVKEILVKEGFFFSSEEDEEFIKNFSFVGKKNLKIQDPKKLLIPVSAQEKKLYYDVAYSIIKKDNSSELSYPYAFKRILEINVDEYGNF